MPRSTKAIFNEGNPNKLASAAQVGKLGTILSGAPQLRRLAVASNIAVLPELAKAAAVLGAFATAGTSAGAKTPVNGAPAAGQVAVNALGNIVFASADAVTAAEVLYIAEEGPVVEETIDVVSNVGTLLQSRAARVLLSVTATVATAAGAKTVLLRGSAPAAGQAAINAAGTGIAFAGADAVARATVRYIATPGVGTTPIDPVADLTVEDKAF